MYTGVATTINKVLTQQTCNNTYTARQHRTANITVSGTETALKWFGTYFSIVSSLGGEKSMYPLRGSCRKIPKGEGQNHVGRHSGGGVHIVSGIQF